MINLDFNGNFDFDYRLVYDVCPLIVYEIVCWQPISRLFFKNRIKLMDSRVYDINR
jgi:hypothetical protein